MSYESAGRVRYQIIVSLGEGQHGARLRALLEAAAKRDGYASQTKKQRLNLSAWARDILVGRASKGDCK